MKKRGFSLILAFAMVLSLLPAAALAARPDEGFTDTRGHWGESSIDRWSGYDIIEGYEGLFYPDQEMTRGGVAKVLANLLGLTKQADLSGYTDVDAEAWYYEFMAKCVAAGIFEGNGSNQLNPDDPISRQEMFTVFARALGIAPKADSDTQFTDDSQIASWAAGYIGALADQGIVTGGGDGSVDPTADIDRASVMALLDKAVDTYVTTDGATVSGSDGIVLVVADNVTVTGSVDTLVVADSSNTVTVTGSSTVDSVAIVGPENQVVFSGTAQAGDVTIPAAAEGSSVVVESGAAVDTVTSEASNVTISGSGTVDNAVVSGDNTSVSTGGTTVDVAEGTSGVTVNDTPVSGGETVETKPSTPEAPPVHIHIYTWHDNGDETHTGVCACGMTTAAVAHTAGSNGKCTVCGAELEAKIGTVGYTTLEKAIDAAAAGSTVTLLKNATVESTIELAKNLTLDLNGHVITAATKKSRLIWVTAENVNLTINGMTAGSGITMGDTHEASNSEKVWGFVDLRSGSDGSVVTVNGGSYTGSTCANDNYTYGSMFMMRSNSTLILNNVSAETDVCVVNCSNYGTLTVNGGNFNITGIDAYLTAAFYTHGTEATFTDMTLTAKYGGCVQVPYSATLNNCSITVTDNRTGTGTHQNCAVAVQYGGTVTVNSGTYSAPYAAYVYNSGGTININGGNFSASTAVLKADKSTTSTPSVINVSGGNFTGTYGIATGATLSITGGTYSTDPSAYVAPGYGVTNAADVYTVSCLFAGGSGTADKPFLIANATQFSSITGFANSMKAGTPYYFQQTEDFVLSSSVISFCGVYDGNGHSITAPSGGSGVRYVFRDAYGETVLKNLTVYSTATCGLALYSNYDPAYTKLTISNITTRSVDNAVVNVDTNNFGFLILNYIGDDYYGGRDIQQLTTIENCTNYASVVNGGNCAGAFIGSGYCLLTGSNTNHEKLVVKDCVNYGNVTSKSCAGVISGNPSYLNSAEAVLTGSVQVSDLIAVSNVTNNGTISAGSGVGVFGTSTGSFETAYREAVGGTYQLITPLSGSYEVYFDGGNFSVKVNEGNSGYTYKVYLAVGTIYFDHAANLFGNSIPFPYVSAVTATAGTTLNAAKIHAYDYNTAKSNSIITDETVLNYQTFGARKVALYQSGDMLYMIFENAADLTDYIDSSVQVSLYAFDSNGSYVGSTTISQS